jgi:CRP-like cAMP-binding protein
MPKKTSRVRHPLDVAGSLATTGLRRKSVAYRKNQTIFSQGDPANSVPYVRRGSVKSTVNSSRGKDAVIALLMPGDFFGEECLAGPYNPKSSNRIHEQVSEAWIHRVQRWAARQRFASSRHPSRIDRGRRGSARNPARNFLADEVAPVHSTADRAVRTELIDDF